MNKAYIYEDMKDQTAYMMPRLPMTAPLMSPCLMPSAVLRARARPNRSSVCRSPRYDTTVRMDDTACSATPPPPRTPHAPPRRCGHALAQDHAWGHEEESEREARER